MRIELKSGATPLIVSRKRVQIGIGSNLLEKDWKISFDSSRTYRSS
jgi:hypothetical protein